MSNQVKNIKLVSFIIPAYNAADTIVRCLDSIYALSLKRDEFEVIVIDDASSDSTILVTEDYRERLRMNNLIILRQQENHRQGAARNRGVKIANGDYICFVDADDAVTKSILNAILLAKETDSDIVALHYGYANERGELTSEAERLSFAPKQVFSGIEMQNKHPYWCSAPWGYIYKKNWGAEVNYPFVEDALFEDSDFVVVHLYYAKRMLYSSELGYCAYYREGSTSRSTTYRSIADYLLLGTRMLTFFRRITDKNENELMSDGEIKFAEGILEGACWNIEKSCKRIIKLEDVNEVIKYYKRIDAHVNRGDLYSDWRIRKYYWNAWTSICIGHKKIAIYLLAILMPIYKVLRGVRSKV